MSEIRVNTNELNSNSQTLGTSAKKIVDIQKQIENANSVGSVYDGQLARALESITNGIPASGSSLQNRASELSEELAMRANKFEAANTVSNNFANNIANNFFSFIENSPLLSKLFFFNKSDMSKATFLWGMGGLGFGGMLSFIAFLPKIWSIFSRNIPQESILIPIVPGENSSKPTGGTKPEQSTFKPQSPLGEYKVTANFPEYSPVKNPDGSITRHLHNGIDLQPKPFDRTKDHAIHPVGPGKVIQVSTQYEKNKKGEFVLDKDGNKIIVGYGNYVIVEHTLSDGTIIYSRYAHMKYPSELEIGDTVGPETDLGIMGETGRTSGPHLHLEIYKEGAYSGFNSKDPDSIFNPNDPDPVTNKEKMQQQFYNPEPFVNGETNIRFIAPK
jgi:murein DD-endopeptidase MepM/ murein hydrolase activator NlpD